MGGILDTIGVNGLLSFTQGVGQTVAAGGAAASKGLFDGLFDGIFSGLTLGKIAGAGGGSLGAVGDIFSVMSAATGARQEAKAYAEAAKLAGDDISLTKAATDIRAYQLIREENKTLGQEQTATAANGFAVDSGSAGDIIRSSRAQGALAQNLVNIQGAVTENGYRSEQLADLQKEAAANHAAGGEFMGILGGVVKAGMSVASSFLSQAV